MHTTTLLRSSTRCRQCLSSSKCDINDLILSPTPARTARRAFTNSAAPIAHPVANRCVTRDAFHVNRLSFSEIRRSGSIRTKSSARKAPQSLSKTPIISKTNFPPIPNLDPATQKAAREFFLKHGDPINPPPECRPPPLSLPARKDFEQQWRYLLASGKAYLTFYKTGISQIWKMYKLLGWPQWKHLSAEEHNKQTNKTGHMPWRSSTLAMWRLRDDVARLPVFAFMLLICGEWTPLIVPFVPGVVPATCHFPSQVDKMLHKRETKKKQRLQALREKIIAEPPFEIPQDPKPWNLPDAHLREWAIRLDSMIFGMPYKGKVQQLLLMLQNDDFILLRNNGWDKLIPEELRYAAIQRGMNVLGKKDSELRAELKEWVTNGGWKGSKMIGGKRK